MPHREWTFDLKDGPHRVELEHQRDSGRRLLRVDGHVVERTAKLRHRLFDTGSTHAFPIGEHRCEVRIGPLWEFGLGYQLKVDGKDVKGPTARDPASIIEPELVEGEISEEPLGDEQRIIDSSQSSVSITRHVSISKEWMQSYDISDEEVTKAQAGGEAKISSVFALKLAAEQQLRSRYSISEQIKKTYTEDVTIEVPPNTKVCMLFKWKRLVRSGVVRFSMPDGSTIELPYRVAWGVTFDQEQS